MFPFDDVILYDKVFDNNISRTYLLDSWDTGQVKYRHYNSLENSRDIRIVIVTFLETNQYWEWLAAI